MYKSQMRNKFQQNNNKHFNQNTFDLYDDLERIKSALAEATQDVKGKAGRILSHSLDTARDTTSDITENVTGYITEKPWQSLSIAIVGGILLGWWLRR